MKKNLNCGVFRNFSKGKTPGGFLHNAHPTSFRPIAEPQNKLGPLGPVISSIYCKGVYEPNTRVNVSPPANQPQPPVVKLFTNNNPVLIPTTPLKLCLANPNRTKLQLINIGLSGIIYGGLGFIPTITNYNFALPACLTAANDGTGGVYIDEEWLGEVWAIATVANQPCSLTELP